MVGIRERRIRMRIEFSNFVEIEKSLSVRERWNVKMRMRNYPV